MRALYAVGTVIILLFTPVVYGQTGFELWGHEGAEGVGTEFPNDPKLSL